jgi:hypothetical protein
MFLVIVHPDFCDTFIVDGNEIDSLSVVGEWHAASVHVRDSTTRNIVHLPVTKPYLETQFILFASPNIEL